MVVVSSDEASSVLFSHVVARRFDEDMKVCSPYVLGLVLREALNTACNRVVLSGFPLYEISGDVIRLLFEFSRRGVDLRYYDFHSVNNFLFKEFVRKVEPSEAFLVEFSPLSLAEYVFGRNALHGVERELLLMATAMCRVGAVAKFLRGSELLELYRKAICVSSLAEKLGWDVDGALKEWKSLLPVFEGVEVLRFNNVVVLDSVPRQFAGYADHLALYCAVKEDVPYAVFNVRVRGGLIVHVVANSLKEDAVLPVTRLKDYSLGGSYAVFVMRENEFLDFLERLGR